MFDGNPQRTQDLTGRQHELTARVGRLAPVDGVHRILLAFEHARAPGVQQPLVTRGVS